MPNKNKKQEVCVYGLIKNKNGETLFIKRADNDTHPGLWELPGGGVDFGEDPKASVKREIEEETGIEVDVKDPVRVFSTINDDKNKQTVRIVFSCTPYVLDKITLSSDHSNHNWILTDSLESFTEKRM